MLSRTPKQKTTMSLSRDVMGTRPGSRPRSDEKLAVNEPNTHFYQGTDLGKDCEFFGRLDWAQKI